MVLLKIIFFFFIHSTLHKSVGPKSNGLGSSSQEFLQVRVWLQMREVSPLVPRVKTTEAV